MERENSWVVVDDDGTHTAFGGFIAIVRHSPVFFWLAPVLELSPVRAFGERCYKKIAARRMTVCLPEPVEKKRMGKIARFGKDVGGAALILLAIYVVLWNMNTAWSNQALKPVAWIGWTLRLDQSFDMFAPSPLTEDGWYVIPAMLQNGMQVNLFKDGPALKGTALFPVSYAKPSDVADTYPDQRWQKYMMNLAESDNSKYRLAYGQYLCRTWNASHSGGETLETFKIYFMIENTPPEGLPNPVPVQTLLWSHQCFAPVPPPPTSQNPVPSPNQS